MEPSTVAAVIIGSEVLTAKIQDLNGPLLMRRLRERGLELRSVAVVHDEVDAIVEAVLRARRVARYVITSGGIGPTHDDVTVRAVSLALGRGVARMPEILELIHRYYQNPTPEALRLADAPEGAELIAQSGTWYPVISCDDVFLLPGVPQLFKLQLETVLARLPGRPVASCALFLNLGESAIAGALDRVALAAPDVAIGSYPQFGSDADHRVMVTVEARTPERLAAIRQELRRELPVGSILREQG